MSSLRVLVVAEGPSEIGDLDALAGHKRRGNGREGYIPAMLRKLLGADLQIDAQRVTRIGRWGRKPRLAGEGDRAAQAVLVAETLGCELLVFVRDVDREQGAKRNNVERRRKLRTMHDEIDAGFEAAASTSVIPIKGTPCRMIEAWALGDREALKAAGVDERRLGGLPPWPEETWGREADPTSDHPKCILRRVFERHPSASDFEQIARESRPDHLAKTCPDSFKPFLQEIGNAHERVRTRRRGP
ncbi:MAG: hypothetical protein JST00_29315 [Deltaproteobacteria bacterium]|nr:hypothetical protein [Deltaproteobacteria bacterium]